LILGVLCVDIHQTGYILHSTKAAHSQPSINKPEVTQLVSIVAHVSLRSSGSPSGFAPLDLEEEHGGEDGVYSELDKVNKANVTARLKEIKGDKEASDEAAALNAWFALSNQEADLKKALKEAEAALDALAYAKYPMLSETEIKTLVVEDKWLAAISAAKNGSLAMSSDLQALSATPDYLALLAQIYLVYPKSATVSHQLSWSPV